MIDTLCPDALYQVRVLPVRMAGVRSTSPFELWKGIAVSSKKTKERVSSAYNLNA